MLIMLALFCILIFLNVPIFFSLLTPTLVYLFIDGSIPFTIVIQRLISGPNSYILLAVPLFILAGNIMNHGGITTRIFNFANVCVAHIPGGLGQVNVLASWIFAGKSGSANADAAALGLIQLKAMREAGYDDDFILGISAASSLIGPVTPPSIMAVIYASAASVSVGSMFLAGVIPGIVIAITLGVTAFFISKKRNYPVYPRASFQVFIKSFIAAGPSLLTPIIIIGGIWSGLFTPTEAAAITCVYAAFLSLVVYREMRPKDLPKILYESAFYSIPFIFIISASMMFGFVIIREQAGLQLGALLLSITENRWLILLIINVILLLMGTVIDPIVSILLMVPVLKPVLMNVGVDMVHFGMIMLVNLMIGLITPPVGSVLNTLCTISKVPFEKVARSVFVFLIPLVISLLLVTYIPQLALFLPNLMIPGR